MARTPFNLLTFLIDEINDKACDQSFRAGEAVAVAIGRARAEGNRAHFDRLVVQYRRFEEDVRKLQPHAPLAPVSLDFDQPEPQRQAA
jgi:hypothetical protein